MLTSLRSLFGSGDVHLCMVDGVQFMLTSFRPLFGSGDVHLCMVDCPVYADFIPSIVW